MLLVLVHKNIFIIVKYKNLKHFRLDFYLYVFYIKIQINLLCLTKLCESSLRFTIKPL